ncbi:MAG TPA: hypothetical protein VKV17_20870 [Bryobacteraceae bacterium]|nr:hypothetical protein [Bryobacteraceae bacterium]
MRRLSALSVLAAVVYSFFLPVLVAQAESDLPACCRRNGAHRCEMAGGAGSGAPEYRTISQRCPAFPGAPAVPVTGAAAPAKDSIAIFAALVSHPACQPQTAARGRVSFSRSRQKRGPPSLLS